MNDGDETAKFAICNELYVDWSLDDAFAHASQAGYSGIELAPFTLGSNAADVGDTKRNQIVELAKKHELELVGLHWLLAKTEGFHLTSSDRATRKRTSEYFVELARLCGDLGGKVLVLGSPHQRNLDASTSKEEGMERAEEVIRMALPELEKQQVVLALEPLGPEEGNFLLTADEAVELLRRIESPYVQLHLDVKAMSTEKRPIPDIIRNHQKHLAHFHANDPNRQGPGMGEVDFRPIFQSLKEINYDGWISVEVFDYEPGIESLTQDSLKYMKQIWETN